MDWAIAAGIGLGMAVGAFLLAGWIKERNERAAYVARLSPEAHEELRAFEMVNHDWRLFREAQADRKAANAADQIARDKWMADYNAGRA